MFETLYLPLGVVLFWLSTFGISFAFDRAALILPKTRLSNATLLSSLPTIPVFLALGHMMLFMCTDCTG